MATTTPNLGREETGALLRAVASAQCGVRLMLGDRDEPVARLTCHLVNIDDDGLWLTCPSRTPDGLLTPGMALQVAFNHDESSFEFDSSVVGIVTRSDQRRRMRLIHATAPEALRSTELRVTPRIRLDGCSPVPVTIRSALHQRASVDGRLLNVSEGGMAITLRQDAAGRLDPRDVYWALVALPTLAQSVQIAVRLVHQTREAGGSDIVAGWRFCGADDADTHGQFVDQVRAFVAKNRAGNADDAG
jgi:c-di-GMP-binding flagellar brake protein YcgR